MSNDTGEPNVWRYVGVKWPTAAVLSVSAFVLALMVMPNSDVGAAVVGVLLIPIYWSLKNVRANIAEFHRENALWAAEQVAQREAERDEVR